MLSGNANQMSSIVTLKNVQAVLLGLLLLNPTLSKSQELYQPFPGVVVNLLTTAEPRPNKIYLVKIDLQTPGLRFETTPSNGDPNGEELGDPNYETTRQSTLQFLKDSKAQLAINTSFYGTKNAFADNIGLLVSKGDLISPFYNDWPAMNIDSENRVDLVRGKHDTFEVNAELENIELYNAFSGSDQIVTNGKVTTDDREFSTTNHPRTAIGFSTKKELFIVAVDGRQPGVSEGISLTELAKLMIDFGCVQAINLDGGGSTTMVIADPSPRVINVPSNKNDLGEYGILRENGANLAIFLDHE